MFEGGTIEPLDTKRHDRTSFASGVAQVDNYLHKTANKLAKADNVRGFVLVSPQGDLVGYYALNAHGVEHSELPSAFARDRPGHGVIPAMFIAMMGVDARWQGQGLGGLLLADALKRVRRISEDAGVALVLLDVLDCGNPTNVERRAAVYKRFGFQALPGKARRLFLPVSMLRQLPVDR